MQTQISGVGLHAWILCQISRGAAQSNPFLPRSFLFDENDNKVKKLKSMSSSKLEFSIHCLRLVTYLWANGLFRLAASHLDANVFMTARTPRICETNLKLSIQVFRYIIQVWKAKEEKTQGKKHPSVICSVLSESIISTNSDLVSSDLRLASEGSFLSAEGLLKWTCILAHMKDSLGANNNSYSIAETLQDTAFELLEGVKQEEIR